MKRIFAVLMALSLVLVLLPVGAVAGTEESPDFTKILYAGQNTPVGEVKGWEDGDGNLCVKYQLSDEALEEGWLIYETHFAVATSEEEIPQNKSGNPVVGQFPYGDDDLDGVESYTECIDMADDWTVDEDLFIAAHAVIEKEDCEVLAEAPYGGLAVEDYEQGLRYDYTAVRDQRSNPDAALTFTTGQDEANFFSLGFQEDRDGYDVDDAWITIQFDHPILNGPDNDLRVIEDTWGLPYPDETADVWVSQNGTDWEYLGEADNQDPYMKIHTISDFDLDTVGLDWVSFVKIQDTSNRADFAHLSPEQGATLDGYDLNAVVALHDHEVCEWVDETAWGEGEPFDGGNWATYFEYTVQ